jgi:hypothetical protein
MDSGSRRLFTKVKKTMGAFPSKKILLIMPPFWDPICPPQGIASLKPYLEAWGHVVHIVDLNTVPDLFVLQKRYFETAKKFFPRWKFLNIYRNGPRYFAQHQLAWFFGRGHPERYAALLQDVLNIDARTRVSDEAIGALDEIVAGTFGMLEAKVEDLVGRIGPEVIGCTMLESTFPSALAILKAARGLKPDLRTVLGGPGPVLGETVESGNFQRTLVKCPWVDAILYGEGELLFENWLEGRFGDRRLITLADLGGTGKKEAPFLNLNDLPTASFEGLPLRMYLWLSVLTARGCPYRCSFCFENRYWECFRKKRLEPVVAEMKMLAAKFRKDKFYICDSLTNHIATPLSQAIAAEGLKYRWDCYLRITPECLAADQVSTWARGGMKRVRIGIESASPNVLKLMNKNIAPDQMRGALETFSRHGIYTTTLWIGAFPGETAGDFQQSLDFLRENHRNIYQADIWEFICLPTGREFQVGDRSWPIQRRYPAEFDDLLPVRYFETGDISREERFDRIFEFERLRMELGIPNPYSMEELKQAHARWTELGHQDAATPLF